MEERAKVTQPKDKKDKFDWADEGLSALVRVVILAWSAAILEHFTLKITSTYSLTI